MKDFLENVLIQIIYTNWHWRLVPFSNIEQVPKIMFECILKTLRYMKNFSLSFGS